MYCKNCGNTIEQNAAFCVKCGAAKGVGNSYCFNCGAGTTPVQAVCTNCGVALNNGAYQVPPNQAGGYQVPPNQPFGYAPKSKMAAGLLGIFLGGWGVHNFYLGFTSKAVIQLVLTICSCGIAGIWGFVEGIMILAGSINTDANGVPLAD
ncbi:MAG: TM2 domain-containing protein [Oscillospiraceae bacterium]|jgi:TM2 domain-containing membrane protein YozV|nr:TM2 domain-containing protein [Oscillospiraceae bacterium]